MGLVAAEGRPRRLAAMWELAGRVRQRLGWGLADQGVSSLTNFAVAIEVARSLGAARFGAFSLAFVTYAFVLNASRGLATDPFLVRVSDVDTPTWRRATASCTGTAAAVGLIGGACALVAATLLHGVTGKAFAALGLCLPGLLLQDSWRFAFFAHRRGRQALANDVVWALLLFGALAVLRASGSQDVFWYVLAWGGTANVAAAIGPLQSKVVPKLADARAWVWRHRDLGPRFMVEGTANNASTQGRTYGVGLILGLAAVGYVQAANTLMGPFLVVFFGTALVALPEAVRALHRSTRRLVVFCSLMSGGLGVLALLWGGILLVALPLGLGQLVLASMWRPTYPLILPLAISVTGGCVMAGAGTGLHALGAARRSMRAMIVWAAIYVACAVFGAAVGGAVGTMRGAAVAGWIGAALFWRELRAELRQVAQLAPGNGSVRTESSIPAPGGFDQPVALDLSVSSRPHGARGQTRSHGARGQTRSHGRTTPRDVTVPPGYRVITAERAAIDSRPGSGTWQGPLGPLRRLRPSRRRLPEAVPSPPPAGGLEGHRELSKARSSLDDGVLRRAEKALRR